MKGHFIMIGENLASLRKAAKLTQEEAAERIGVTRQAIAKWEKGESVPDLYNCTALAKLYGVTLDDLVNYSEKEVGAPVPPKGKHFFGSVTVGDRGQIVIPKKAREVFNIKPGDNLMILGDEERGIAIVPQNAIMDLVNLMGVFSGRKSKEDK